MSYHICEKRRSVIESTNHCLVIGGPGSGKTSLALMKAVHDVERGLYPGQSVLFLSFSRAAVARISDAAKHLKHEHLKLIDLQTFHSFFWSVLQGHAYLLGTRRTLSIVPAHEEASLRDGIKPDEPGWAEWEQRRYEMFHYEGRLCFDLFAPLAAALLGSSKRIRKRISYCYPIILVDEAQDTSENQWECVRLLSSDSQIVCLADPDQMIYANLPGAGISADRLPIVRAALKPHEIDLGSENNRSPGTEIVAFARDIYLGTASGTLYHGVSLFNFQRTADKRDAAIRQAVGIIRQRIREQTGSSAESIAILSSYSRGVAVISSALQRGKPIPHQVLFDEAFALLSVRVVAYLLEPQTTMRRSAASAILLELAGAAFRAKGTVTGRAFWNRCSKYADQMRRGQMPKVGIVHAAGGVIDAIRAHTMMGDSQKDWILVQQLLARSGASEFIEIATQLDYFMEFARGRRIREALSGLWCETGRYSNARTVLDTALAQEQLRSVEEQINGIHVMNSHKAKGKQFDGVILYRQEHHSPFRWRGEDHPYSESRRLLHMAITRARKHVLILNEVYPRCPILSSYSSPWIK